MIDPAKVCLFIPSGMSKGKRFLFNRIGGHIKKLGGRTIEGDHLALDRLPDEIVPIIGAAPYLLPLVRQWRDRRRVWIGWDRGYVRRVFATWLPRGDGGGYYRWHVNRYQMDAIRQVPGDRWKNLLPGNPADPRRIEVRPWRRSGHHIVVALPSSTYSRSHDGADIWKYETLTRLQRLTLRPIVLRDKETKRPLQSDLDGAHCLVTHGSITAVESVILGCPVFVDPCSAAALVGLTDIEKIESPVCPERQPWLNSLAYSQYCETELVDGTLWRLLQ